MGANTNDPIGDNNLSKIRFEFYYDFLKDHYKARVYLSARLDIIFLALFILNITFYSRLESVNDLNIFGIQLSIVAILIHVASMIYHVNKQNNEVMEIESNLMKSLNEVEEFESIRFMHPKKRKFRWDLVIRIVTAGLLFGSLYLIAV